MHDCVMPFGCSFLEHGLHPFSSNKVLCKFHCCRISMSRQYYLFLLFESNRWYLIFLPPTHIYHPLRWFSQQATLPLNKFPTQFPFFLLVVFLICCFSPVLLIHSFFSNLSTHLTTSSLSTFQIPQGFCIHLTSRIHTHLLVTFFSMIFIQWST